MRKIFVTLGCIACVLSLNGCTGVQSASLDVNPVTMSVGGTLVFKNGRWQRVMPASRDIDPCGNARAVTRAVDPCAPAPRAVVIERDPCGSARTVYANEVRAEIVDLGSGGVRGLVATRSVSSRSIAREVTARAKAVQEEERDAYRALKAQHKAEDRRLDTIVHASSQTLGGRIRRAFTGTPCTLPIPAPPAEIIDTTTTVQPPVTIVTPTPPVTPDDGSNSGFIPPPTAKSPDMTKLEARLTTLEKNQAEDHAKLGTIDTKLDAIMAAVKKN